MEVNLRGTLLCTQLVLPDCADRRRPHPGRLRLNDPSMKLVAIVFLH
jgi:hypothetical protein